MSLLKLAAGLSVCSWVLLRILTVANRRRTRRRHNVTAEATVVGFFHPFCAGGGGGERVLWRAVLALSSLSKDLGRPLHVLIYTGDLDMSSDDILSGVARQFDLSIDPAAISVSFVYVSWRGLLDASRYPVFTMLAQSMASMMLAAEALFRGTPDVFVDTTGFAFSFPVAWIAGCSVGAYVHYPTISTDMLSRVRDQRPSHNNSSWISSSVGVSRAKLLYYHTFAFLYGVVGGFASNVMVNSSWTKRHISALWGRSSPAVVFPPCDTSELESLPINDGGRERCALSVGQFRPEKDHALQVRALAALRKLSSKPERTGSNVASNSTSFDDVRLVILGSCRNDDDREVLERTRALAVELGVEERVEFVVNCSFDELKAWLGRASVGLHTMWNEHFGIGVVEMMAAGMVTIAHRSGGPAADIVVPLPDGRVTGFLAETPEEYAEGMARVFGCGRVAPGSASRQEASGLPTRGEGGKGALSASGGTSERGAGGGCGAVLDGFSSQDVRVAARESARRFSNEIFDREFSSRFAGLLQLSAASAISPRRVRKEE
eukprot:jgi/Undpi1/9850/HiC_scaffold_28.g12304.m1